MHKRNDYFPYEIITDYQVLLDWTPYKAFYEALQADKQRSEKTSSVVQMLKTEAGRISFKFSASVSSPPLIGDLRNALKRARYTILLLLLYDY